ncbi:MAG: hypothetical protein ACOVN0_06645 [Niveispirillum sp.]|uniref:hypothetical protein n=1 Tax=Niveispirillum sp. TaxID=1917217 RepID=UPI003BA82003
MRSITNLFRRLSTLALLAAGAAGAMLAIAQETLDEIVATGSRIRQSPLTQTQPVIQLERG